MFFLRSYFFDFLFCEMRESEWEKIIKFNFPLRHENFFAALRIHSVKELHRMNVKHPKARYQNSTNYYRDSIIFTFRWFWKRKKRHIKNNFSVYHHQVKMTWRKKVHSSIIMLWNRQNIGKGQIEEISPPHHSLFIIEIWTWKFQNNWLKNFSIHFRRCCVAAVELEWKNYIKKKKVLRLKIK